MNGKTDISGVPRGLRFGSIVLANWRNFGQAEASLQRRVFLVGPNASGKSNFLDAFRFLRDLVTDGGGLQEAVRRRGGVSSLRALSARRPSDKDAKLLLDGGLTLADLVLPETRPEKAEQVMLAFGR